MATSPVKSRLIDIAPTLFDLLRLPIPAHFEGIVLHKKEADTASRRRKQEYYFYEKKTPNEWTRELHRFVIHDKAAVKDDVVTLTNNPRF